MEDKKIVLISLVVFFIILAGIAFYLLSRRTKDISNQDLNRGDYLKKVTEIGKKYYKSPNNKKVRLEYAKKLFEIGEFSKSQDLLKPLLNSKKPPADATYLSAHIEYLFGHYSQAEKMFESLAENSPNQMKMNAQVGLLGTYYQTNRYGKARNLFIGLEGKIKLALWEMMKAFGDDKPYQIEWKDKKRVIVPFVVTDPLPVISVEINGKQIYVILDTGGEIFYIDESVASSLGIKSIARQVEPYAGGKTVEVGYGRADSLKIGDVTLKSIPVKLSNFQRFSSISKDNFKISGMITTGVLQQFLATIDYPENRLILRPRNKESQNALKTEFAKVSTTEIPFVLSMTHLMICKGTINEREALNLLVDSGLADSTAALCLPKQTLDYLGISAPLTEIVPENKGGLAGGDFSIGRFDVEKVSLGSLQQNSTGGIYGLFPPQLYLECEFIIDALVSHQFLKKYKWTIDFDSMKMVFTE